MKNFLCRKMSFDSILCLKSVILSILQVEIAELRKELKAQQQNNVMLMDRVRTLQAQVHV